MNFTLFHSSINSNPTTTPASVAAATAAAALTSASASVVESFTPNISNHNGVVESEIMSYMYPVQFYSSSTRKLEEDTYQLTTSDHNDNSTNETVTPDWSFLTDEYLEITPTHWLQFPPQPCSFHYVIAVVYIMIFIPGSLANLLMVSFFFRIPSLQTPSNLLNLNLAAADLLMNSQIPGIIWNSLTCKPSFGVIGCKLHGFFSGWAGTVAIVTICAMSVERYIKISKPFASQKFLSYPIILTAIALIWLYGLIFASVPLLFESSITAYVPEGYLTTCSFDYLSNRISSKIFIFTYFVAAYVIPLSTILYSYQSIICIVRTNRKSVIQGMLGSPRQKSDSPTTGYIMDEKSKEELDTLDETSYCEPVHSASSPNFSYISHEQELKCTLNNSPPPMVTATSSSTATNGEVAILLTTQPPSPPPQQPPVTTSIAAGSIIDIRLKFLQKQQQEKQEREEKEKEKLKLSSNVDLIEEKSTATSSNESSNGVARTREVEIMEKTNKSIDGATISTGNNEVTSRPISPKVVACSSKSTFTSSPNCSSSNVRSKSNISSSETTSIPLYQIDESFRNQLTATTGHSNESYVISFCPDGKSKIVPSPLSPLRKVTKSESQLNPKNITFQDINPHINLSKISSEIHVVGAVCSPIRPISSASIHRYTESMSATEKKLTYSSLVLIAIWTLAWTPYALVALIGIFTDASLLTPSVSMVPAILCKTASLFDPIVYSYSHPKYRELMSLQMRSLWSCITKPITVFTSYFSYLFSRILYRRPYDPRKSKVSVRRRTGIKRKSRQICHNERRKKHGHNVTKPSMENSKCRRTVDSNSSENGKTTCSIQLDRRSKEYRNGLTSNSKFSHEQNLSISRESTFSFTKTNTSSSLQWNASPGEAIPLDVIVHKSTTTDKSNHLSSNGPSHQS